MVTDIIQLCLWLIVGAVITWGIFFSWVGFRHAPNLSRKRLAKAAEIFSLAVGIMWIMLWVTAVFVNIIQIWSGDSTWHPLPFPSSTPLR